ncbi:MAG: 50S ribosomal protein L24 [Phycisphaeraceae bacterium]|nr:50S ribosomal protein L24 [Phycisphaeraceae bacterium]
MPRHIRKGDLVIVTAGNDRGATGEVLAIVDDGDRVVVQGVNVRTKHLRPTQQRPQGSTIRREFPVHISNVSPVVDGKPTRVRFPVKADGTKVRVAARGGKELHVLHRPRNARKAGA